MTPNDDQLPDPSTDAPPGEAELERIHALLSLPGTWAEPDPTLEERVLAGVRRAAAGSRPGRDRIPLAPPVPDRTETAAVLRPTGRAARAWRPRLAGALVGVAAASLLVVGVALARRPAPPKLSLSFVATGLAPEARGTAKLTETNSGWQIRLDTQGLARLDNGRYYEAWLEGPKGIVSIGTFHTGAKVTLWAGVEADEYAELTVTIEQEDGNPASSLQRVLSAAID